MPAETFERGQEFGRVLGILETIQANQERHSEQLDQISGRVGKLETKIATHAAVGGGAMAAVVALGIEYIKAKLA